MEDSSMFKQENLARRALDIEDLPSLKGIFNRLDSNIQETLKPMLARMPLLYLLNEIMDLAEKYIGEKSVHQALLDLALLAVVKNDYTRRLYLKLVEAVMTPAPEQFNTILTDLPKADARLAMEILALMSELLALAGLDEKGIHCFKVAKHLADRFGLMTNHAVAMHQLGLYQARCGKLADAEAALNEAARGFSLTAPDLYRQTNLLRAVIYGLQLGNETNPPPPDDLEAIMATNPKARQIVLLARARKSINKDNLDEAETLCAQAQSAQNSTESLPAVLLLIQSKVARKKGLFEKADLLLRQVEKITGHDELDRELAWEAFYLERDLCLNNRAQKLLEQLQDVEESVRVNYQKALIAFQNGDQTTSEKLFKDCLEQSNSEYTRANCYGMLGLVSQTQKDSRRYLYEAIGLYSKLNRRLDQTISLFHLGLLELIEGQAWKDAGMPMITISQFHRAEELLEQAQSIADVLGVDSFLLDLKIWRARLEQIRGHYNLALGYFEEAVTHIELVYLTITNRERTAIYIRGYEPLYVMAISCAIRANKYNAALLFGVDLTPRRFLRDTAENIYAGGISPAHPLLKEENNLFASIRPLRIKLSQARPLSIQEQQVLYQAEERIAVLWQQIRQTSELSEELSGRIYQPLEVEVLRQIVFNEEPGNKCRGKWAAIEETDEEPKELPGGGLVKCPRCHVYNRIGSTFCSACEEPLPKTAQIDLNLIIGNATDRELRQAYADHLYNIALEKISGAEIEEANNLLSHAMQYSQHPDYSFFYGLCRLALGDSAGAIKSFEDIKSQQYASKYPFWPLPVSPSDFQHNFDLLKQDETRNGEIHINLLAAYKEYIDRRGRKL